MLSFKEYVELKLILEFPEKLYAFLDGMEVDWKNEKFPWYTDDFKKYKFEMNKFKGNV